MPLLTCKRFDNGTHLFGTLLHLFPTRLARFRTQSKLVCKYNLYCMTKSSGSHIIFIPARFYQQDLMVSKSTLCSGGYSRFLYVGVRCKAYLCPTMINKFANYQMKNFPSEFYFLKSYGFKILTYTKNDKIYNIIQ